MESAKGFTDMVLEAGFYDFENGDEPTEAIALVESRDAGILRDAAERAHKWYFCTDLSSSNALDSLVAAILDNKA